MEFSEEWKSIFPIGSVFEPPLLISENPNALGPLFFNPKPKTTTLLFNSPSLSPPVLDPPPSVALRTFLSTATRHGSGIPPSTASSIASVVGPQYHNFPSPSLLLSHNRLQFLKCPLGHTVLVFFPSGPNNDQVGFLLLSVKEKALVAAGENEGVPFTATKRFGQQIVKILVHSVEDSTCLGGKYNAFGYLLVYTMYSVHWFCVTMSEVAKRKPLLTYLGGKVFKTGSIVGACWSPHLPEESMVLREDGSLFLFDLQSNDDEFNHVRQKKLKVSWDDIGGNLKKCKWLGCEFSWHPRILVVARTDAVFIVDLRYREYKVTCLAKTDMLGVYATAQKERFLAFAKAASTHFHFVLASDSMLILCDVRKPLATVLQWTHGLHKPRYIDVLKLSQLRSNSRDGTHEWATASGFGIVLGSFWQCEFGLFCYGPPVPPQKGSFASEISKISNPMYAWELPSDFLLSDHECQCGSCLVREEFWRDSLPEWIYWQQKKNMVLGFGILSNDLSSLLFEPDEFGGFTLIRLMSSGKLESQRYCASWDLFRILEIVHRDSYLCSDNSYLTTGSDEKYMFPRRFTYLKLDYLCGYLNNNLSQVLDSSIAKACKDLQTKESFNLESHEILCKNLKDCGFGRCRTSPAITVVFNDMNSPSSVYEVASRRIWADLPMEILQLAFSSYPEFQDMGLPDQNSVALDFSVVPDQPQLPPFFLRKPSAISNRRSQKHPYRDDVLVGPVLPLPVVITLHELRNGCPNSQGEVGGFSSEVELNTRCTEVLQVANPTSELNDNDAVSLADNRDHIWHDLDKPKSLFLYHPSAFHSSSAERKDDKFGSLIAKVHDKRRPGVAIFDDLCPVELKIDAAVMDFSRKELQAYNFFKRNLLKWQEKFTPYQEFCSSVGV